MKGSAAEIEAAAAEHAAKGSLVLASTGRLARRLLHRCRLARLSEDQRAWATPRIMAFRRFVMESHASLWDEFRPISRVAALCFWSRAMKEIPPPEGIVPTPALFAMAMDALDVVEAGGLEAIEAQSFEALPAWRAEASHHFLKLLRREGFLSYKGVASRVAGALRERKILAGRPVVLVECEKLSYPDALVAEALEAQSGGLIKMRACVSSEGRALRSRVWATPEQECRAVLAEILEEWNRGGRDMGLVYLDGSYRPLLRSLLGELAGNEPVDLERSIRYNLAGGDPLPSHPLFESAVLPLRAVAEPSAPALLESYFTSVYLGFERRLDRAAKTRAALHGRRPAGDCKSSVAALEREGLPVGRIKAMSKLKRAPLGLWLESLDGLWKQTGFPSFAGSDRQMDAIAWQHLGEAVASLGAEAGKIETTAREALAWLREAASSYAVAFKTPETTGLQVLPAREAAGLAFQRLWVVGAHGDALPGAGVDQPLLSSLERRLLPECTPEGRWEEAGQTVESLLASAPSVLFSRAAGLGEEAPYLPCPLIPDEAEDGRRIERTLDLWSDPPPAWLRARWLMKSLVARPASPPAERQPTPPLDAAREWSVTSLERLAGCPFAFFASDVLLLEPVPKALQGIDPLERGGLVHSALRRFILALMESPPGDWPQSSDGAKALLSECVDLELQNGGRAEELLWQVERERLLGDDESPGVLGKWLELERRRAQEGWRPLAAEAAFSGLDAAGLWLKGRVDRVDAGPHGAMAVWDYKTGAIPTASKVLEKGLGLQLPAYLLALKRGLVKGVERGDAPLQGGFICLRSAGEVSAEPLVEGRGKGRALVDWDARLPQWEEALRGKLEGPMKGEFPAEPSPGSLRDLSRKGGACEYCPYDRLCGYFDEAETAAPDDSAEPEP